MQSLLATKSEAAIAKLAIFISGFVCTVTMFSYLYGSSQLWVIILRQSFLNVMGDYA